jgi:hypothetical protein
MSNLIVFGPYNNPEARCDECGREFIFAYQKQFEGDTIQYCPFCGEGIDEIIDEMTASE